jgi:multidrug efflux system membrane fusion protein
VETIVNDHRTTAEGRAPTHPKKRRTVRLAVVALVIAAGVGVFALRDSSKGNTTASGGPAPVPVTAGAATTRDLPIWFSGIGSVQPLNVVTVKVRVDGQLNSVAFTEGQEVHAGDPLAEIDPRPFRAQLKQAEANRAKDQAQLANTKLDLARFSKLASVGASTGQNVDTLKAQVAQLEAAVEADQAMIDTAQLQLGFTSISSPIDGRVGLRLVDPGSIVHATDANGLVTVTEMQPISVLFSLPQDELPDVLAAIAQGMPTVEAYSRDGTHNLAKGTLVFVDSQVDPASGQVRLKATFANADRQLWPGEFVDARLLVRTDANAVVVPTTAVLRGQNGSYVYALKADQTVEVRPVTTGTAADGFTAILSGLAAGDNVVFEGQFRLTPGTKVAAQPPSAAAVVSGASQ